jgi:hypothetical protein
MKATGIETEIQGVTLLNDTHAHAVSCDTTAKLTLQLIRYKYVL